PYYRRIRYIDRSGSELIKVNRRGLEAGAADQRDEPFFTQVRGDGTDGICASDIVPDGPGGALGIHWAKAIYSGLREFAGAVVIDLDFGKIIEKVRDIQVEQRGYAFLIDSRGRLIAHPRFAPFSLHLDNLPTESLRQMFLEMMSGASEWRAYHFEGEEKVAAFAPVPLADWSLAVTIPQVVFKKEAQAIQTRVVQAVVLTLVVAVAGVVLMTWILLKPVRTLASATDRIASGDLNHEIPIHSTDELGDLSRSFNRMVKNLARIQNELVRSEKLISLGRLSAGVAHEIRNPLNAMKGAIVYLQRRRSGDALVEEYTRLVSEEIDRLNLVVTEFLYFARQSPPKRAAADINRLIVATQQLFEERARQSGIRFHNQLDGGLPEMLVDPHQFEQVLVNLVINAMDALPDGGDITFTTRVLPDAAGPQNGRRCRMEVMDNGIGIARAQIESIFDPFFSTKDGGTGLGLPLSLGIVENHGGSIRVASEEGVGTTVIIECPIQGIRQALQ
ncbi:MAG TPA: ATP-binding protein, partial [Desulfosarcina sp.]|nr:ATP-binding protein [Desulfosarcina sp.]